jgi:hypothetical protein
MYSAAASLYEHNAEVSIGKSIRESLWSQLHAFEYFTLVSDHVRAERASKKYADLAKRVDRFETRTVFESLKNRRENVLVARSNLGSRQIGIPAKNVPEMNRIQRSMRSFLQQVQSVVETESSTSVFEGEEQPILGASVSGGEDEDQLVYESESDFNERRIVS